MYKRQTGFWPFFGPGKMTIFGPQKVLADILINVFVARGHVFGRLEKGLFRVVFPIKVYENSGPDFGHFLGPQK